MTIKNIKLRANYLKKIRNYFDDLNVLEVDTPLAYEYGVTDPFIDVFPITTQNGKKYLQSSPEYAMKRILSDYKSSIYQICKAFRDDPKARLHNYEFTMIEWYRTNIDYFQLMKEMEILFKSLKSNLSFEYYSYEELFKKYFSINPHKISLDELKIIVKNIAGDFCGLNDLTIADCLDILFSFEIEKKLSKEKTVYFVYDYTAYQSALAKKIIKNSIEVATRFEVFYNGIELANGYDELIDKTEQLNRFKNDLEIRKSQNKEILEIDTKLLECLDKIPQCSGVAMGLDRLILVLEDLEKISDLNIV